MNRSTWVAVLALALLPIAALAQSAAPAEPSPERAEARAKVRNACSSDVQTFCADIERGKGAMRGCLDQHEKDLSPACATARTKRAAVRAKEKI